MAGDDAESSQLTIKTSDEGWLAKLAKAYRERSPVLLVDDAKVGIDPSTQTILDMGRQAKLRREEWIGVLVSLGVATAGIVMIAAAVLDPDPTSKLGLLIASGAVCLLTGGFSAIRILTKVKPPSVELTPRGIHLRWD